MSDGPDARPSADDADFQAVLAATAALREPVTELHKRLATLEAAVAAHVGSGPPAGGSGADPLRRVWGSSSLAQRLQFLRGLLAPQHPMTVVLAEVLRLVELCNSVDELEAWLTRYPTVFAEAVSRVMLPLGREAPEDDLGALAQELLREAGVRVTAAAATVCISWVRPGIGDELSAECEVVGDVAAGDLPPGRIQAVRRVGFRRSGRLELPAQVVTVGKGTAIPPQPLRSEAASQVLSTPSETAPPSGGPEWYQVFRIQANEHPSMEVTRHRDAVGRVVLQGQMASDGEVIAAFQPLLSWLGSGWGGGTLPEGLLEALAPYRTQLLGWLASELQVELILAVERDTFLPETMEVVSERRTAHPHERGTVARLQAPGLRRADRVLVPARVIRYAAGEQG